MTPTTAAASPTLVIVQNRPTQFDAPLYARLRQRVELSVYYTEVCGPDDAPVDEEIGRVPVWDNMGPPTSQPWVFYSGGDSVRQIARDIARKRPALTIVAGYSPHPHGALSVVLKLRGLRVGLRSDNTLHHSPLTGAKGMLKKAILPHVLRLYDSWHPVGTLAREYLETLARTTRPVHLFPYSPDIGWLRERAGAARANREELRREIGFSPDDFVVLGAVKWNLREDPLTLVEGFVGFLDTCPRARLILAGDGPLRPAIEQRLAGRATCVSLPGYVPYSRLAALFALADVFVHPPPGEPWGVSVNEAMACGLPVVAAEGVGAARDLVVAGETGYTFPDGDAQSLAAILSRMSSDPDLTARMGRVASQMAESWSHDFTIGELTRSLGAA